MRTTASPKLRPGAASLAENLARGRDGPSPKIKAGGGQPPGLQIDLDEKRRNAIADYSRAVRSAKTPIERRDPWRSLVLWDPDLTASERHVLNMICELCGDAGHATLSMDQLVVITETSEGTVNSARKKGEAKGLLKVWGNRGKKRPNRWQLTAPPVSRRHLDTQKSSKHPADFVERRSAKFGEAPAQLDPQKSREPLDISLFNRGGFSQENPPTQFDEYSARDRSLDAPAPLNPDVAPDWWQAPTDAELLEQMEMHNGRWAEPPKDCSDEPWGIDEIQDAHGDLKEMLMAGYTLGAITTDREVPAIIRWCAFQISRNDIPSFSDDDDVGP